LENKVDGFIYGIDEKPNITMQVLLGLQHVFAAFGGIIAVPIIVSSALGFDTLTSTALISGSMLAAGIATIIQSKGVGPVGAKLPSLMGTDVTFGVVDRFGICWQVMTSELVVYPVLFVI
jgi:NCS2 family nucleobase:cation symporter-2